MSLNPQLSSMWSFVCGYNMLAVAKLTGCPPHSQTHGAASCCVIFSSEGHWRNDCRQMLPSVSELQPNLQRAGSAFIHTFSCCTSTSCLTDSRVLFCSQPIWIRTQIILCLFSAGNKPAETTNISESEYYYRSYRTENI